MKLITKIFICILSFILLSLTLLHFALVYILPIDDVKNKIITIIEKNTNASVSINKISASLLDFSLNNVDISSGQEKFAHIEKVHIYFSPLHLLKGKIKILSINLHTVELDVVKNEYGHFNFENLINKSVSESEPEQPSEKEQKETKEFINLLLCKTHIQNGAIRYIDLQNKLTLNISQISFFIEQFSFDQIFKLNASVQIDTNLNNKQFDTVYLALNTFINLHSLDLNKAKIDIDNFVIKFKETVILLNGNIENFNDPAVNLNIKIKDLSHNTFADIAEIPEFLIPEIDITAKIIAFIEKRNIRIDSLNIATMDSTIDLNGNLDYGQKEPAYDFKASFNLLLEKIGNTVKMLQEYKPTGNLKGEFTLTDKNLISGVCRLVNIGCYMRGLGYFTDINSNIAVKNADNIKISKLTGNLNKNPFLLEASYLIGKNSGNISMLFRAKKILGEAAQNTETAEEVSAPKNKTAEKTKSETKKWSLPPLNITADFMVEDIDTMFFKGKDILFKMNLSDVTPVLDKVKGTMNFQSGQGTIKDLYKLTNSNALMKGLFLSLDVVSRVINALNVLDILNSIGSAVFTSDAKNTDSAATDAQPEQKQKLDGKMDFDSFITFLKLDNGKAAFEKCSFVSGLLSFKVDGEMNFKEDKLDMTVNAAPGRHEDDGIMPLTMKITGTTEEPSGSLSLLGSVSSIVSQSLLNNAVSDGLKKGFMSLLGLKKHDEKGNEIQEVNISTNTFTNQEPQKIQ
ncbi:MAG: AsmA family protein [Endomicrobiaceae bacterium]|jgi:hypothetical protein|nr:AsmA family protein [Endomicrobiaceae bacterium]MDD4166519.1 AsmA family protein [Endomicrobiaceae bacterium]